MKVPIEKIKVSSRFRREFGEIKSLATSLEKYGQIQPIIIDSSFNLIAGERRFRAAQLLGWTEIEVQFREEADELTKKELELEENLCRKDFTDKEKVEAVLEIHRLKTEKYGRSSTSGGGWTLSDTAKSLNMSPGYISQILTVAEGLEKHREAVQAALEKAGVYAAYKETRRQQIASVDAVLVEIKKAQPQPNESDFIRFLDEHFFLGNCIDITKRFPDGFFHFIHTDSPYGIGLRQIRDNKSDGSFSSDTYQEDSLETFISTWTNLAPELFRVSAKDAYALLWCSYRTMFRLIDIMTEAGWLYRNPPFTWVKTDSHWFCSQPGRQFASATDIALLFAKGDPLMFRQGLPNFYLGGVVKRSEAIHTLERPKALYDFLHPIFTVPGMNIFDPFAGSASCLRAAYTQGLNPYGCEIDEIYYNRARLKWLEEMKGASKNEPSSSEQVPTNK